MGYRTTDPVVRRPITTQPIGNVRRIGPKPEDVAAFNEALAASVSGAQFKNGTMPAFFYNPSASRRGRTLSRQLRQPAGSYVNQQAATSTRNRPLTSSGYSAEKDRRSMTWRTRTKRSRVLRVLSAVASQPTPVQSRGPDSSETTPAGRSPGSPGLAANGSRENDSSAHPTAAGGRIDSRQYQGSP